MSAAEYAAEARRLETIRNEALQLRDVFALKYSLLRLMLLNRAFWGRELRVA